ncbi:hypothetical protein B6259_06955 [Ruminococcaceae bacterium CPB6]|jgi:hypothetical protein|nr:hypothetical protein B6259_06955 [Ruminococcaceae bacterium CPB6]
MSWTTTACCFPDFSFLSCIEKAAVTREKVTAAFFSALTSHISWAERKFLLEMTVLQKMQNEADSKNAFVTA